MPLLQTLEKKRKTAVYNFQILIVFCIKNNILRTTLIFFKIVLNFIEVWLLKIRHCFRFLSSILKLFDIEVTEVKNSII
jgi:hypothetical protein